MRVITVARKPLSESSVAANVLEHGTGAINVDACRVAFTSEADAERHAQEWDREYNSSIIHAWDRAIGNHPGPKKEHNEGPRQTEGRWPANLILQHRAGCRSMGTTTVQSDGHFPATRPAGSQVSGPSGHTGQERLEERFTRGEAVQVWDCEPGCPVADLDLQSGVLASHGGGTSSTGFWARDDRRQPIARGDEGGASRFFKQVGGLPCE